MSKKDPSFDDYLDQQIEEHMRDEILDDYPEEEEEEEEEEEDNAHLEEDADDVPWGHKHYPSLRHFNPLTFMLEEENDL